MPLGYIMDTSKMKVLYLVQTLLCLILLSGCVSSDTKQVVSVTDCDREFTYEVLKSDVVVNELTVSQFEEVLDYWKRLTNQKTGRDFRTSQLKIYFDSLNTLNRSVVSEKKIVQAKQFAESVFSKIKYCDLLDVTFMELEGLEINGEVPMIHLDVVDSQKRHLFASILLTYDKEKKDSERIRLHSINPATW